MANHLIQRDPFASIARFDPFMDMDDLMRDFFSMPALRGREVQTNRIRTDISENDKSYLVHAEMPGVSKDDIKVSIDGNRVTISAEVREEKRGGDGDKLMRSERYFGQQYRSFTLPQEVDDGAAEAKYENGILELSLPKKAGGGAKQLTIQ